MSDDKSQGARIPLGERDPSLGPLADLKAEVERSDKLAFALKPVLLAALDVALNYADVAQETDREQAKIAMRMLSDSVRDLSHAAQETAELFDNTRKAIAGILG